MWTCPNKLSLFKPATEQKWSHFIHNCFSYLIMHISYPSTTVLRKNPEPWPNQHPGNSQPLRCVCGARSLALRRGVPPQGRFPGTERGIPTAASGNSPGSHQEAGNGREYIDKKCHSWSPVTGNKCQQGLWGKGENQ